MIELIWAVHSLVQSLVRSAADAETKKQNGEFPTLIKPKSSLKAMVMS